MAEATANERQHAPGQHPDLPPPSMSVGVIGCGGIGLSAVQGARIAGANKVIAVDMVPSKLDLAQKRGATHVVDASDDPVSAVKELTGGVHHAFEAVGLKATAEPAFKMLRRGGQATVIGMIPVGTTVEVHGPELLDEKTRGGSTYLSLRRETLEQLSPAARARFFDG